MDRYFLWFSRTFGTVPPLSFTFITLITYQFSFLPFACLGCPCASLCSRTLVYTSYPTRRVDLSTYVIKSFEPFSFFFTHPPIVFRFSFFVLRFPPPRSCLSLFTFYHFSIFSFPFNPSRLHFSQLASPACFLSPCVASVLCSRTGESD